MKGFIMNHKKGLAIFGILLLIFVILCIFVWGFLFPDGSKSEYGNRLDGIDKVRISDDKLKKLETELEGRDFVKSADAYITGRIINVMIDVNDGTDVATAKALTEVVKSNFSEDELAFYDTQVYLTNEGNSESSYPYIGYKHRTESDFFWTNNQ